MYNKIEVEKNLALFESSLNEVFAKLSLDYSNEILRERAELTLQLAEHVKESLKKYNDLYVTSVIDKIDTCKLRFEEIKAKYLLNKDMATV